MRFNKLLLGAALLVPMMMTSCDPDAQSDPIEITYEGTTEFSQCVDSPNFYYTCTLPFKLSRELKDGEYMDEVRFNDYSSSKASTKNSKFIVDGKNLNLQTTLELSTSPLGEEVYDSGNVNCVFNINILKKSGSLLKQFNSSSIKFNIEKKYITLNYDELDTLLSNNGFELDYYIEKLTKDKKTITVAYHNNSATSDFPVTLGLYKTGQGAPITFDVTFSKNATTKGTELTIGTISDAVWDSDYENHDAITIKKYEE